MIVEVPDLIAEWLADGTYGVNALLAAVPRKGGDAVPAQLVNILAATRSGPAARGKLPNDSSLYPMLVVGQDGRAEIDVSQRQQLWQSTNVPIAIGYCVREVLSDVGTRDAGYTLRAVMRSLWKLFAEGSDALGVAAAAARNNVHGNSGIAVQGLTKMELVDTVAELDDAVVMGAVRIELRVRDNLPGG